MKVGIVAGPIIPVPPPRYGGTEQVIYFLIKGLKEAGHEPILFGSADSDPGCELVPISDRALYFPKLKTDLALYEGKLTKIKAVTEKKIREHLKDLDIIHSHGFDLYNFRNFPSLTTIHSPIELAQLKYYQKRQPMNFVSVSKNQQAALPNINFLDAVYNGEDPSLFPQVTKPQNYLSFIGRFDEEKNPHLAIELAISIGMKIKLAGKIDYRGISYFRRLVQPFFKHPLVEYLGELNFKEKVKLLSKAKCNLHPTSFREPFGLTVIEAAYCGTPTLAIARGSMPEIIKNGQTGILVEDFIEGYHKIKDCFELDRTVIADASRQRFNYQKMTKQYLSIYDQVINTWRARRDSNPRHPA